MPIDANFTGGGPPAVGGSQVPFTNSTVKAIAEEIAKNELEQCAFASTTLTRFCVL